MVASGEILSRRYRKIVLRYHKPNKEIHPGKYAHCLSILFYSFTDKKQLVMNRSCVSKFNEENVFEIINQNKQISNLIDNMFIRYIKKEIRTKMIITL